MTRQQKETRYGSDWGKFKVTWDGKPVQVGEFVVPPTLTVEATPADGGPSYEFVVEIDGKRARVTRLTVLSDEPWGVSSTTLRRVQVRDLAATALHIAMKRVTVVSDTHVSMEPVDEGDVDAIAAVARLVGYTEGERL